MPWWIILITELVKLLPDIIPYFKHSENPRLTAHCFKEHVKNFEQKLETNKGIGETI